MSDDKAPNKGRIDLEAPSITHPDPAHVEIKYPKDPFEIGKTVVDGNLQPIWVDPKDFIRTGEQNDELASNIVDSKLQAAMELARREIMAKVEAWIARVMQQIMPRAIYESFDEEARKSWLAENDINQLEDSKPGHIKFILRRGTKIISEFNCRLKGVNNSNN